jgi:hypothetical protein
MSYVPLAPLNFLVAVPVLRLVDVAILQFSFT